jgi:hypothetical protein
MTHFNIFVNMIKKRVQKRMENTSIRVVGHRETGTFDKNGLLYVSDGTTAES